MSIDTQRKNVITKEKVILWCEGEGKNTQKNYTEKIFMTQTTTMVWSLTWSQTLECEVKWTMGSITRNKASGGDGIPDELFQFLKYDAVKVLYSICQQIWKTQQWPQNWKRPIFVPITKKGNANKYSNYHTIALISHASKVMLKILQARLQQYMNRELPNVQAGFRKGRGSRDQIANVLWIMEKAREFQKTSISALLTMSKPLTVWITINCGKFWKRWEYQTTWPASWETCM